MVAQSEAVLLNMGLLFSMLPEGLLDFGCLTRPHTGQHHVQTALQRMYITEETRNDLEVG